MKTLTRTEIESQPTLKAAAFEDLQQAWKALRRMEDLSENPQESKSAAIAVALLDKALNELERGPK